MENQNDFHDWTEAYNHIRRRFCERCEAKCSSERRTFCVEQFLYIAENWEITNDYHHEND
jgi:hypothetical protein